MGTRAGDLEAPGQPVAEALDGVGEGGGIEGHRGLTECGRRDAGEMSRDPPPGLRYRPAWETNFVFRYASIASSPPSEP